MGFRVLFKKIIEEVPVIGGRPKLKCDVLNEQNEIVQENLTHSQVDLIMYFKTTLANKLTQNERNRLEKLIDAYRDEEVELTYEQAELCFNELK